MQAAGQNGDVPQYVASRVGASHGHSLFNLSHDNPSLPSSATTAHAHGHGLSLSHPPAHSQASQSHIQPHLAMALTQPSFLQAQQQQQQQHVQHGFNVSVGGAPPKTSSSSSPSTSHPPVRTPQPSPPVQSAAQQLQADIKQHQQQQQQQSHQIQLTAAHDLGVQKTQQEVPSGDAIQLVRQKEQPVEARGNTVAEDIVPSTHDQLLGGSTVNKTAREETLGDGDEMDEEGERGSGGNRWPRQEALALLKIRSEMDAAFRDSSLKGPLWEEISRKLAEMGYHRSAKKCKEKFENVHKYYKRTKEGKTGRQDGKSYRFFTQLEALYGKVGDSNTSLINLSNSKSPNPQIINVVTSKNSIAHSGGHLISLNGDNPSTTAAGLLNVANHSTPNNLSCNTISSPIPLASYPPSNASMSTAAAAAAAAKNAHIARTLERVEAMKYEHENNTSIHYFFDSSDNSEDTNFDDEDGGDDEDNEDEEPSSQDTTMPTPVQIQSAAKGKKRKRESLKKYLNFFEKAMKTLLDKQEHMQQKFLDALEKRDHDRMIREEAWKRQEMVRLNQEQDVRAAERSLAASRDASLVAFLQKMTGQSITLFPPPSSNFPMQANNIHYSTSIVPTDYMQHESNADRDIFDPSSKRWPKLEVLALIKLRTSLDQRFHEPGSKAILWEEISSAMANQGYSRTAKRCKEKWENINKYFKKAKESNKKRPENAKTCPYFNHLNALYKEGLLGGGGGGSNISSKHLIMLTEKEHEQSKDVMDQGVNSSKDNGDESRKVQERDSTMSHAEIEIVGSRSSNLPMPITKLDVINPTTTGITTSASLTLMTSSTNSDTKMHMFMGIERCDMKDHPKIGKTSSDNMQTQPTIDSIATSPHHKAPPANSLLFSLNQAMSSNQSGPPMKQFEQAQS
ncbi:hypothetical protein L7F22_018560 [Adiantum nelumboides]|nr:hypothetical protein [Adiantum nelumboides]